MLAQRFVTPHKSGSDEYYRQDNQNARAFGLLR